MVWYCYFEMFFTFITTGKAWNTRVRQSSSAWRVHLEKYLRTTKTPTLVVKYENLLTDLHTELKRMMEFLKFPYTEDDLQCTINSTIEGFHRKHKNVTDPYATDRTGTYQVSKQYITSLQHQLLIETLVVLNTSNLLCI